MRLLVVVLQRVMTIVGILVLHCRSSNTSTTAYYKSGSTTSCRSHSNVLVSLLTFRLTVNAGGWTFHHTSSSSSCCSGSFGWMMIVVQWRGVVVVMLESFFGSFFLDSSSSMMRRLRVVVMIYHCRHHHHVDHVGCHAVGWIGWMVLWYAGWPGCFPERMQRGS